VLRRGHDLLDLSFGSRGEFGIEGRHSETELILEMLPHVLSDLIRR
jgi:hypothetical protein